jgi:hypothetical protein
LASIAMKPSVIATEYEPCLAIALALDPDDTKQSRFDGGDGEMSHADLLGSEGRAPVCFWSQRALFERELVTPHWASSRPPPLCARPFF